MSIFKPAKEVMAKKPSKPQRIVYWGESKVGKTRALLSFPKPIFLIDLEGGWYEHVSRDPELAENVMVCSPIVTKTEYILDDNNKRVPITVIDYEKTVENMIKIMGYLPEITKDHKEFTIGIDSITEMIDIIKIWNERRDDVRKDKSGKVLRTEYQYVKRTIKEILWSPIMENIRNTDATIHIVMIARQKDKVDSKGQTIGTTPDWHGVIEYMVDTMVHLMFRYDGNGNITGKLAQIVSRIPELHGKVIPLDVSETVTYEKLLELTR